MTLNRMINKPDENGFNMFHRAALDHNKKFIEEIEETTPDFKFAITDWLNKEALGSGDTPLSLACMKWNQIDNQRDQCRRFIAYILKQSVETNKANYFSLWTALHWAAVWGDVVIVKNLLNHGASPVLPDAQGYFPIDLAGYFGHKETVKILIEVSLTKFEALHQKI